MILGMSTEAFTTLHVAINLIGIATGLVVAYGLLTGNALPALTGWFLATTVLTSATGFLFHSTSVGPPHAVGLLSLVLLSVTIYALYGARLAGHWRWAFIAGSLASLYFNVFVGVVQAFQKLPPLHAIAPTGKEPPFAFAQLIVLAAFIGVGVVAARRFHPQASAE